MLQIAIVNDLSLDEQWYVYHKTRILAPFVGRLWLEAVDGYSLYCTVLVVFFFQYVFFKYMQLGNWPCHFCLGPHWSFRNLILVSPCARRTEGSHSHWREFGPVPTAESRGIIRQPAIITCDKSSSFCAAKYCRLRCTPSSWRTPPGPRNPFATLRSSMASKSTSLMPRPHPSRRLILIWREKRLQDVDIVS